MPRSLEITAKLKTLAGKIMSSPLEGALADALNARDVAACRQLHALSNVLTIPKSHEALETLASAYSNDPLALRTLVEEVSSSESILPAPFARAVLETDVAQNDEALCEELFAKVADEDVEFLRAVLQNASGCFRARTPPPATQTNTETEECVDDSPRTTAAGELASLKESISGTMPSNKTMSAKEIAMRANDIRSCGKNGDLRGAMKVFQRLGGQSEHPTLVNSMVEACIECNEMEQAQEYFKQAKDAGIADASTYNTMMKGHISQGQEDVAKNLLTELSGKGLAATRSSFHGLLNARVNARDLKGAWKLVEDMQGAGLHPNAVTCSILMKGRLNSLADVSRVLALIDAMDQPMDEVLFLSVVEACIRTGRLDLLSRQYDKFMKQTPAPSLSAPTFGTMIKAYGHARDVKKVWQLWDEMIAHRAQPTAVTMGCMVEALVANGCALDAWRLTQRMWSDEQTKSLVNTVIYSSIVKGFAHNKETDKVMALYEEMKVNRIQANTITFNTILNAFAQGGAMQRVPALLEDMKTADPPVEPDIVTYSTIVKGFCNTGSLDRALKVLKEMKASGKYEPDEVMYNSLLSGCAKEHRPDEALQLLSEMKKSGVAPSNYTLSMLVKLMGRCKRLNQAFVMLDDISREYGLKINVQVYTCLIQGCFNANQANKAISLHEKIIKEGLQPDAMTYAVLVRGFVQAGMLERAVDIARAAHGIDSGSPQSRATPPGLTSECLDELLAALGGPKNAIARELKAELADFQPASSKGGGKGGKGGGKGGNQNRQQRSQRKENIPAAHNSEHPATQAPWRTAKA
jgi:pentatricopeptide repeat protein